MPWIIGGSSVLSWSDARDKVRGDLWRKGSTAIPDDVVDRALHASILEIEAARHWIWLQNVSGVLTLDADASLLNLPAACGAIHSLSVYWAPNAAPTPLRFAPMTEVQQWNRTFRGYPTAYARGDGTVTFDSTAPALTQFEIVFQGKCPDLLPDAVESPPITLSLHQQAVLARAKSLVALEYLHDDDKAARNDRAFNNHLDRMIDRDDQLRGDSYGGEIAPNDELSRAAHGR